MSKRLSNRFYDDLTRTLACAKLMSSLASWDHHRITALAIEVNANPDPGDEFMPHGQARVVPSYDELQIELAIESVYRQLRLLKTEIIEGWHARVLAQTLGVRIAAVG